MSSPALTEIPVTRHLSKGTEARLAERAAATSKPLAEYIATLVESVVETPEAQYS